MTKQDTRPTEETMNVKVTARHCEVDDDVRNRAVEQVRKVARVATRPQRAEIVFDRDHDRSIAEFQLYLVGGKVCVSTAEASDFRTAIDRSIAKLRNQLDKMPGPADRRVPVE
jgi:ribosomal subunit interface protein